MIASIRDEQQRDFLRRGFSRRDFTRISLLLGAAAALPFYNEPALAQLSDLGPLPPDAVKLNANENPMGPCPEAAEAIHRVVQKCGRYMYDEGFKMAQTLAEQMGLKPSYAIAFPGSSDPLHRAVLAYTSPTKPLVIADPSYEAPERAAKFIGAPVIHVPLRPDYSHDLKAMAAASPDAGLIYVCNPNNPTGTITPKTDIEWLVANKPTGAVVMIDEAYIHWSEEPFATGLVGADKDVIILRTFSKIYGMAGLRAGVALGRPDLITKLKDYGPPSMPVTAMVGASASLAVKNLVPERRKIVADIRNDVFDWMTRKNYSFIPSVANMFMVDVKRPGQEVVQAMAAEKVYIGRGWPIWPTYVRVTVGSREDMEKFKTAFQKVMSA
jgi:histidinol-phosphate aminotransferase